MYVCMYVCVYVCIYVNLHTYLYPHYHNVLLQFYEIAISRTENQALKAREIYSAFYILHFVRLKNIKVDQMQ